MSPSFHTSCYNITFVVTVQQRSGLEEEFLAEEEALKRIEDGLVLFFEGRAAGAEGSAFLIVRKLNNIRILCYS